MANGNPIAAMMGPRGVSWVTRASAITCLWSIAIAALSFSPNVSAFNFFSDEQKPSREIHEFPQQKQHRVDEQIVREFSGC
mmetsp:Transcript_49518/g.102136  ORF Transcript_49518/g.102136 Transcript_49518/m.102136 type:complete len:81 (+) Transcript_49518:105-347(+)